jgi:hypothetical protein
MRIDQKRDVAYWLGVAEVTAADARREARAGARRPALAWARIATRIFERLAMDYAGDEAAAMMLRAYLVTKLGPSDEEPMLNVVAIVDWFFATLDIGYDDAVDRVARRDRDELFRLEDARVLGRLKRRLGVIELLASGAVLPKRSALEAWRALGRAIGGETQAPAETRVSV